MEKDVNIIYKWEEKNLRKEKGSILILVLIVLLALSLIGNAGIVLSQNEFRAVAYKTKEREAFFTAEAGMNYGYYLVQTSMDISSVVFQEEYGKSGNLIYRYRTGHLKDKVPQPPVIMSGFTPPYPPNVSVSSGLYFLVLQLNVVGELVKATNNEVTARKELESGVLIMQYGEY